MPGWKGFDAEWYRRRYHAVLSEEEKHADDSELEKIWLERKGKEGRSPNRFFDEEWYLFFNRDIGHVIRAGSIFETGFQHYEEIGFGECPPHWLFCEKEYFKRNPDLSYRSLLLAGFVNGYDHYISVGDKEGRQASLYFQPELFLSQAMRDGVAIDSSEGPFSNFLSLKNPQIGQLRTSWYFDPEWYLKRYSEVEESIHAGRYGSALEHYLCNHEAFRFDPNPYFNEAFYLAQYPDIEKAVQEGHYRNGYEHFLSSGLYEGRQPNQSVELDLGMMRGERAYLLKDYNVRDPFAFYIRQKEENFSSNVQTCSVESARKLAVRSQEAHLPALYRKSLVFERSRTPELSVVLFSEGDYLSVTATLISLYEQGDVAQEIIIVTRGNFCEQERLEKTFKNLVIISSSRWMTEKALFLEGVKRARSKQVLLVYAGVTLHKNAYEVILSHLRNREVCGVGGQVLSANQKVLETGIHLFRDGTHKVYGLEGKAFTQEISFTRQVSGFQRGAFFVRKLDLQPALTELSQRDDKTGFFTLTTLLSSKGKTLLYSPDFVMTDLETGVDFQEISDVTDHIRHDHPAYIAERALPSDRVVPLFKRRKKKTALFIYQRLPLKTEGGYARRAFDLIDIFGDEEWDVTILALHEGNEDRLTPLLSYGSSIKWFVGDIYLHDFFLHGADLFDLVWLSGSQTARQVLPIMKSSLHSAQDFVLDLTNPDGDGLHSAETYLRNSIAGKEDQELFLKELREELSENWLCRAIVTDNEWEAKFIRALEIYNVLVIPNRFRALNSFSQTEEQTGLFFPLPIYKSGDAGHDALDWFCLKVVPVLKEILAREIPVWIGAYHHPDVNLGSYERFTPIEGLNGTQGNSFSFEEKIANCRLVIVPARVMTHIPSEIMDAMATGRPAVMSSTIFEGLKFTENDGKNAGFNDPETFAYAIADLYMNEEARDKLGKAGSRKIINIYDKKHFRDAVIALLTHMNESLFPTKAMMGKHVYPKRHFKPAPVIFSDESDHEKDDNMSTELGKNDQEPGIKLGVTLEM